MAALPVPEHERNSYHLLEISCGLYAAGLHSDDRLRVFELTESGFDFQFRLPMATADPSVLAHPDLLSGFIRLHVLHHATGGNLTGAWMMEELLEHGYRISPGTLYPMLHGMERKGYLESSRHREGKRSWRAYRITVKGEEALAEAKSRLRELFRELIESS